MARQPSPDLPQLTPREREVRELLRLGLTNAEIAEKLDLSVDGVKYHVSEILQKLGVRSRHEAAYWPDRPPWWAAALAPVVALRRLARLPPWLSPVALTGASGLLVAAIAGLGLLAFLLARDGARTVTAPIFLPNPVQRSGPGWTLETRVANLTELDLVLAAEELPDRITLVDMHSGEAVAVGTFGENVFARLRDAPLQLIVADYDLATQQDRLHIFDIEDNDLRPVVELPLPERATCQGFCDLMYLLPDDHDLFISQRSLADRPECQQGSFNGELCFIDSLSLVDLNNAVGPVPIPVTSECPIPTSPCATSVPSCGVIDLVPSLSGRALIRCNNKFLRVKADGELSPPFSLSESDGSPVYGAELPDGSFRVITIEGRVYRPTSDNKSTAPFQLPIESAHRVDGVWRVDDTHALVSVNPLPPEDTYAETLLLVDLAKSKVIAQMKPSKETRGIAVLDPARAVLLLQTSEGFALQQVDLVHGTLGQIVPMRGLPGGPVAIVR